MECDITKHISEYGASFSIYKENRLAISELSLMDNELAKSWLVDIKNVKNTNLLELVNTSKTYYYNRLNVPKEIRGNGFGKLLLEETINFCNENNILLINTINNYGDMTDKQLIDFYKKSGMILMSKEGLLIYHKDFKNEKRTKNTP